MISDAFNIFRIAILLYQHEYTKNCENNVIYDLNTNFSLWEFERVKIRNQEFINAFGRHVSKLRMARELSQEALAALANIEQKQLARIELGQVNTTISTVYAIATALGISHHEIFKFEFKQSK